MQIADIPNFLCIQSCNVVFSFKMDCLQLSLNAIRLTNATLVENLAKYRQGFTPPLIASFGLPDM